jgi:hypothetical protein
LQSKHAFAFPGETLERSGQEGFSFNMICFSETDFNMIVCQSYFSLSDEGKHRNEPKFMPLAQCIVGFKKDEDFDRDPCIEKEGKR